MKKIVAISVMFALAVGAVFAQTTVGGVVQAGATLLQGSSDKEVKQNNTFYAGDIPQETTDADYPYKTELTKDDEVGKDFTAKGRQAVGVLKIGFGDAEMGGKANFYARQGGGWFQPNAFAYAWWRPNEFFRIQAGNNPDGDWGSAQITGWGFNSEAQDFVAIDKDSSDGLDSNVVVARGTGFYDGISNVGASVLVSLFPIEGLTFNIGLPWNETASRAMDKWLRFHLQAKYALEEIGTITFTYEGQGQAQNQVGSRALNYKGEWFETDDSKNWGSKTGEVDEHGKEVYRLESPKLWLSFFGNKIVDGLAFDVGFGYQPKLSSGDTPPIQIGLGVTYAINEELNIKLRTGAKLAGKSRAKYTAKAWEKDTAAEQKALLVDYKTSPITEFVPGVGPGTGTITTPGITYKETKDGNLWSEDWATATEIGVQILPSYKLSAFTFYLGAGIGFTFYPDDAGNPNRVYTGEESQKYAHSKQDAAIARTKAVTGGETDPDKLQAVYDAALYTPEAQSSAISWYINPYIRKKVGSADLMVGVKVWSSGKDDTKWVGKEETSWKDNGKPALPEHDNNNKDVKFVTKSWYRTINWAIPIGVNIGF